MQPNNVHNTMNKARWRPNTKPPKEWVNVITWEQPKIAKEIEIDLEPTITKNKIRIKFPKTIITQEEDWQKLTLVGRFVRIRPSLDVIRRWMIERWCIRNNVELVALPLEFLLFKFRSEEDIQKILDLGPWFLGRKSLVLKQWYKAFRPKKEIFDLTPT